jgi:ribosomal protein L11 methylase PrmA
MSSGLYDYLVSKELMVSHKEVTNVHSEAYKTIHPVLIPFISYPHEWSFDQFKDAALLTLRLQKIALKHGMILKDASAYNVQFLNGKAIFIDSLSFEAYKEGQAWDAYRQFCQHFLAPLSLAAHKDIRFLKMMSTFIDGIPLDLAAKTLPKRTKLQFSTASHIHWHAKAQGKHADKATDQKKQAKISKTGLLGITDSLRKSISKLTWNDADTEWGDYYNNTNYSDSSFQAKKDIISGMLKEADGKVLWDMGANDGTFSKLGMDLGMQTIAFDIDPVAVNKNYNQVKKEGWKLMLPIVMDLTNPSPPMGWANDERDNLADRSNADVVMALALIHHLAISNNLPLDMILSYFSTLGEHLIIEFVPKEDSKVQTLLATRQDIFPNYHLDAFEQAINQYYEILDRKAVSGSERTLYLLKRKS